MRKNTSYTIKGKVINIDELMNHYNGNAMAVCQHIENACLVNHNTAKYYVDLYMKDQPFKKKWSTLSILSLCFCIPFLLSLPIVLAVPLLITVFVLLIVDLATQDKDPIPKKHVGSIIALCVCVFVIVGLIETISDIGSSSSVSQESSDSDSSSSSTNRIEARKGEGITYGDAIVNLTDCYEGTDYQWAEPKDGYKVVTFEFQVINNGDDTFYFSYMNATGYADNVAVDQFYTDSDISLELAPGRTGTGTICFEVPEDAQSIEMDYTFNSFTEDTGVFIFQ